jgi:2-oxoglutarate dehydrogenase E2 component (dihydrolipoamide succinyltransferase)
MSLEVKIPAVGESITSGLLSTWHKNDGDSVQAGDTLLTLETDKVSTELQAERAGVLRIKVPAGSEVKIGEVVATIEERGAAPSLAMGKPKPGKKKKEPAAEAPAVAELPSPAKPPMPSFADALAAHVEPPAPTAEHPVTDGKTTRAKMSPLRRKIAAQLVMAQHTAAILTTFNEADMSAVMRLRGEMQDAFTKEHGIKLGFMSFFIKASIAALKAVPAVNGRIDGDDFIQNHYYDIGVAVGTERGLIVPVIRDADRKSFAQIERELADYASKAREAKIKLDDLSGGVFTISNGGIYGSLLSTPILNPPQSGILGMHKIDERPIAEKGQVVIRPMMYLALSYDHRVVDGKQAVTFLVRIKECIENPARLLLET